MITLPDTQSQKIEINNIDTFLCAESIILVSFFYKYASADCNKYLYPFIKQSIDNKARLTDINEQIKFVPDIEEVPYKEDN